MTKLDQLHSQETLPTLPKSPYWKLEESKTSRTVRKKVPKNTTALLNDTNFEDENVDFIKF